jgi:hypothetical protein
MINPIVQMLFCSYVSAVRDLNKARQVGNVYWTKFPQMIEITLDPENNPFPLHRIRPKRTPDFPFAVLKSCILIRVVQQGGVCVGHGARGTRRGNVTEHMKSDSSRVLPSHKYNKLQTTVGWNRSSRILVRIPISMMNINTDDNQQHLTHIINQLHRQYLLIGRVATRPVPVLIGRRPRSK